MARQRASGKGTVGVDSTATGEMRLSGAGGAGAAKRDSAFQRPGLPTTAPEFLQQVADQVRAWFPRQIEGPELVLIDVDPRVLHAFWSLPLALVEDARAKLGADGAKAPLLLRFAPAGEDAAAESENGQKRNVFDVVVSGLQSRTYIDIEAAARRWRATLGIKGGDGNLIAFAHSNVAVLPPLGPAPLQATAVEASAKPTAAAAQTEMALPEPAPAANAPAAATPPVWAIPPEANTIAPAETAAITEAVPAAQPQTAQIETAQIETAPPEPASGSEAASGTVETAAGPFALEEILPLSSFVLGRSGKDVELEVVAELYIHGRTEPGRTLQLFGKDIRVRPDGTFALRRILPNDPTLLTALLASEEADDLEGHS